MPLDLTQHPCFNAEVRHSTGRIHLPVASRCNIQCNYCNRKFDCMNESRPGVTSVVLNPHAALNYLGKALEKNPRLRVVGIAGPGDPFATPEETLETMRLVRERYPEILLCVSSNGLNLQPYVAELQKLQVSHVTVTINAVDPAIAARIYSWARDGRAIYRGEAAGRLLIERQIGSVMALKAAGVTVKVNTILVPGINDGHVLEVAAKMRELRVDIMNCIPLYPVTDTPFEMLEEPKPSLLQGIRMELKKLLPQMEHCTRCRADAVGLLGEAQSAELIEILQGCATGRVADKAERKYVAVTSMEGMLVNQHLGEATSIWIFNPVDGQVIDMRSTPMPGGGNQRWRDLASILCDCTTLLTSGVGQAPRWVLEREGVRVIEMAGLISDGLLCLHSRGEIPSAMTKQFRACGSACQGTGMGCS